ncbi:three-Cys-motif partner protein TcmP [Actinokineospora diospyrosa]|uniref:Three-Cys-motif partner protein n=1 Tax=Actinokineospora diospyrosa TaxID=103728 RepID=A0ABT1IIT1_9PSEU|nr:three-Cys-motif partner protein TcmP [Actinokineospora diospyrosa]MCP2272552.1 three-Cys-motif partner protein [Actinokineospora diospyrosa]
MPVDGEVPWQIAEHTAAKHDIYRRYLERWFPILLGGANAFPSATYAEGFAGPGVYKDGEPGSPVIAIKALVDKVANSRPVVKFLFIDDDQRCVAMLQEQILGRFPERPRAPEKLRVRYVKGTCIDQLEANLDDLEAWGQPILAVLDSWGNAPIDYKLLQRLASNVATEVIVTFGSQSFVRFVSKLGPAADAVFGGDQRWREVAHLDDGPAKRQHMLNCYRETLGSAGFKHLLDFELVDRRGEVLYLVFGTNHQRGVEKMKDTLWDVDPVKGVGFRDPRDEQHETLFEVDEPLVAPLGRLLLPRIQAAGPKGIRVHDLRKFALHETVFRQQHVIRALEPLRASGKIETTTDGPIRISSFVRLRQG